MDIFNGNRLLDERLSLAIDWGKFIVESYNENLSPFVFLYKDREKVKTLMLQETEDDFEFAVKCLEKEETEFDQFVIGYQTNIQFDEASQPMQVIALKAFDKREESGHFFIQEIKIDDQGKYKAINKPKYIDRPPLPISRINGEVEKDVSVEPPVINVLTVKDGDKLKAVGVIGHHSETEIGHTISKFIHHYITKYDEKNLSGSFEIDIQPRPGINKDFLAYIVRNVARNIIVSDLVVKNLTQNLKPISITIKYTDEVLFNDSTVDATRKLGELFALMNHAQQKSEAGVDSKNHRGKSWWQFWK